MLRRVTAGALRRWTLGEPTDHGRAALGCVRRDSTGSFAASFAVFVGATFLFGWVAGLLVVLESCHLLHVSGWVVFSGAGYVTLMLVPVLSGFSCARIAGRLVSRGWGGAPVRLIALGVCGLVAGLMAI